MFPVWNRLRAGTWVGLNVYIDLITQIKSGVPLTQVEQTSGQIVEPKTVTAEDDVVTTTKVPDTSLVTPVNTVGDTDTDNTQTE